MRNIGLFLVLFFVIGLFSCADNKQDEINLIKEHYLTSLLSGNKNSQQLIEVLKEQVPEAQVSDQVVVDVQKRYPLDTMQLRKYLETFDSKGYWTDINYNDEKRSGWEPKLHADRLLVLTKFYVISDSQFYEDEYLGECIHKALNYWFDKKYTCSNWWYNEIGVPKTMGEVFILFEKYLSDDEKQKAISVMENSKIGMTGQNRVWLAGNVLVRALLQNDYNLLSECRNVIMAEVINDKEEGIKPDWSFHQHGPMQQFGNYGLSYIMSMAFYANLFNGTSLAFTDEKLDILTNFLGQGFRWTLWKGYMDVSALTRQLFKNSQRDKAMGVGFAAADLSGCDNKRSIEISDSLISDNFLNKHDKTFFVGHKHFSYSDYTIHRSPDWMSSLRMSSSRVIGTELVNEDNLKGYYLGDGALFTYVDGDEYLNVMPFWNWRKIPGITSWDMNDDDMPRMSDDKNNKSAFVGGVSNGDVGMSVMKLDRDSLYANKAWIMEKNFILCLGSGINSKLRNNVMTSIDQRFKVGDVKYLNGKTWKNVEDGDMKHNNVRLYHDKVGYICVGECNTFVGETEGSWSDLMGLYAYKKEKAQMFTCQINHGNAPKGETYEYFILPNVTPEEVEKFNLSSVNIVENSDLAQIIEVDNNRAYIIAYSQLKCNVLGDIKFSCETPGLYMLSKDSENKIELVASDPLKTSKVLECDINGTKYNVTDINN